MKQLIKRILAALKSALKSSADRALELHVQNIEAANSLENLQVGYLETFGLKYYSTTPYRRRARQIATFKLYAAYNAWKSYVIGRLL